MRVCYNRCGGSTLWSGIQCAKLVLETDMRAFTVTVNKGNHNCNSKVILPVALRAAGTIMKIIEAVYI
jgi:hypothetical protein